MKSRKDYEDMSRDELVAIVGDVSPDTPREDLITMAIRLDNQDGI